MSGYIGPLPVPQGIQRKQSFTATASQTTFNTNGYTDGNFINVYLNGVRLINGTDYTATNGSDIVLTTGASASDVLDFETFDTFELVNQTFENVTLKNPTHEDTDGGRESAVSFKGEQSGGEISTLAQIQASHDGTSDDQKGDLIFKTNDGSDNDAPTEAARIDSSRNVLIGKTAVGSTSGIELRGSIGYSSFTRDGNFSVTARRLTDDGDIVQFEKDTTVVGNIGTFNGDFYFGQGAAAIIANSGTPNILPYSVTSGGYSDNAIDLGQSNVRFKDLYLSGGVYVGGTTSANYLDDYEEGTWTPQLDSGVGTPSYSQQHGTYTKIGRQVMAFFYLELNGGTATSDNLRVINLPFTNVNDAKSYQVTSGYVNSSAGFGTTLTFILFPNETRLRAYQQTATSVSQLTGSNLGNSFSFLGRVLYFV